MKSKIAMFNLKSKSTFSAILLSFTLLVAALWVFPAVVAAQKMVTDPTTGKMVTAPEYGGTLTFPYVVIGRNYRPLCYWRLCGHAHRRCQSESRRPELGTR